MINQQLKGRFESQRAFLGVYSIYIEALISVVGGRQGKELNLQSRVAEQVTLSNKAGLLCKVRAWRGKTGTRTPGLMRP